MGLKPMTSKLDVVALACSAGSVWSCPGPDGSAISDHIGPSGASGVLSFEERHPATLIMTKAAATRVRIVRGLGTGPLSLAAVEWAKPTASRPPLSSSSYARLRQEEKE